MAVTLCHRLHKPNHVIFLSNCIPGKGYRIYLVLLIDPNGRHSVDHAADDGMVAVIGINGMTFSGHGTLGHGQVLFLVIGVEHRLIMPIWIVFTKGVTNYITFALTHGERMIGGYEVLVVLEGENTAVLQYIGDIQQVDVIIPLADAVGPMVYVIDKIDVKGVPLAVFPVAHAPLGLHAGNKVVITVGNDFRGKGAIW